MKSLIINRVGENTGCKNDWLQKHQPPAHQQQPVNYN